MSLALEVPGFITGQGIMPETSTYHSVHWLFYILYTTFFFKTLYIIIKHLCPHVHKINKMKKHISKLHDLFDFYLMCVVAHFIGLELCHS